MARKINPNDRDPFSPFTNGATWDQVFDGNTWRLDSADYNGAASTLQQKARDEYTRRNGELKVTVQDDVVFIKVIRG